VVVRRRRTAAASVVTVLAITLGLAASGGGAADRTAAAGSVAVPTFVKAMSLTQLAGERVVFSYPGPRPPASLMRLIRAGDAAGVILFSPNITSRPQIRAVVAELQRAALVSPVHRRLLIMTDQEGGLVRRLPGAPTLSEEQIGERSDGPAAAAAAGRGAGANLAGAGLNVNLAPVLDVARSPHGFIDQYGRSYSSDPAWAARLGASFVTAQQQRGVAATAKHFPGLGAAEASQNTDLRPVRLPVSLARLRNVDEAPYGPAIAAGVRLVMTSWAVYPALDPRRPAGLSPVVLQRELRDRLGFRGVTITDGIDAGAVTPYGSLGQRATQAAKAGQDLILCVATDPTANAVGEGATVLRALTSALRNHRLGLAAARQAAARVLALRARP
jgi:beta-N-acetylhexosaminidase